MAKKKNKKNNVQRLEEYFSVDSLEHWQRLMADLDIDGYFASKTQCKKALRGVWVNIRDFFDAVASGQPVPRHRSRGALIHYTESNRRFYRLRRVTTGSPLAALLVTIE